MATSAVARELVGLRVLLVVIGAALALATVLVAAQAAPALAAAPTDSWQTADVTLLKNAQGTPTLLVTGTLKKDVELPAKVAMAIPPSATVAWAGEILGGDVAQDPPVQYTIERGSSYDLASFTLAQSRIAQVEIEVPDAVVTGDGQERATVKWTSGGAIPTVRAIIIAPGGATVLETSKNATTAPAHGGLEIASTRADVKRGQDILLEATYELGDPIVTPGQSGATSSGGQGVPLWALLAIGAFLAVAAWAIISRRRRLSESSDDTETEGDEGKGPDEPAASASDTSPDARRTRWIAWGITGVLILAAIAYVASQGRQTVGVTTSSETAITRVLGQARASDEVTIRLSVSPEADLQHESDHVFDALAQLPGLASASIDVQQRTVTVRFDSSSVDPDSVVAALRSAGYTD